MESFYMNGKKIIGFLILVLIFNMIFDTKSTEKFVLIVLFSMCILNADKFISFMQNTFDSETVTAGTKKTAESFT